MKKVLGLFIVLFAVFALAACGGEEREPIPTANPEGFNPDTNEDAENYYDLREDLGAVPLLEGEYTFGGVAKAFENEYWRTLKTGMETGAAKFYEGGINVTIDMRSALGEGDQTGQLAIVQDMITRDYDAILVSPITDGNLVPGVEDALEAGIPVVNVNDGIVAIAPNFVGPNAYENGVLAAHYVGQQLGGASAEGQVAIVTGMSGAFAARQRTAGFKETLEASYPGIVVVEEQTANWSREEARNLANTWFTTYDGSTPEKTLDAIFANNDTMALGIVEANEANNNVDPIIVGVDGISEAYDAIREGKLDATVDSFPLFKGQIAVEMAIRILAGQEVPRVVHTPQALITIDNVDESAEDIIAWTDPEIEE
ncbi:MAG: substrate-binding domain-containing protein [Candidatus Izemoplasmatales bacterium]